MYNERWKFEVYHEGEMFERGGFFCVCITWKITNLNSGFMISATETKNEAFSRMSLGRTISSKIFKTAMERRAKELESELNEETDPARKLSLQARINTLRPQKFCEGSLSFGLQHGIVQTMMKKTTE